MRVWISIALLEEDFSNIYKNLQSPHFSTLIQFTLCSVFPIRKHAQEFMLSDVDISSSNHSSVWETIYVSIRSRMVKLNMTHMNFRILGGIKRLRWIYIWSHGKILLQVTRAGGKTICTLLSIHIKNSQFDFVTHLYKGKSRINFKVTHTFFIAVTSQKRDEFWREVVRKGNCYLPFC